MQSSVYLVQRSSGRPLRLRRAKAIAHSLSAAVSRTILQSLCHFLKPLLRLQHKACLLTAEISPSVRYHSGEGYNLSTKARIPVQKQK
jgi:hypothetical protein